MRYRLCPTQSSSADFEHGLGVLDGLLQLGPVVLAAGPALRGQLLQLELDQVVAVRAQNLVGVEAAGGAIHGGGGRAVDQGEQRGALRQRQTKVRIPRGKQP